MRIPRIFVDANLTTGQEYIIVGQAAHHIARVLRLTKHDALILFNNTNSEFSTTINSISKSSVTVLIEDQHNVAMTSPINITLIQSLAKGEKMDFIIQKATELGVSRIIPVSTSRSVVKISKEKVARKVQHWQKVMTSACEQSGRTQLVEIMSPRSLTDTMGMVKGTCSMYFDPLASKTLSDLPAQSNVTICIGPEGGFSDDEVDMFKANGIEGIKFGSRILRTETAAIATLTAAGVLWGDLG